MADKITDYSGGVLIWSWSEPAYVIFDRRIPAEKRNGMY